MTIGSLFLLAVVVAMFVIGAKVRGNAKKIEELEQSLGK